MAYDVIGDVHGQDGKLNALLAQLGYRKTMGAFRHPEGRTAVFVGDLIDCGDGQREVVDIARRMQDAGSARVIMGNHELNAIGYATPDADGTGWLRRHDRKNVAQHAKFIAQVGSDSPLHRDLIAWFRTLPVALDLGAIRVCHAWWDAGRIAAADQASDADGRLTETYLRDSFAKDEAAYDVMEGLTKGLEVELPDGGSFQDHAGVTRTGIRLRWWDESATTYRAAALVAKEEREKIPAVDLLHPLPGNPSPVPVFVGHYCLRGEPAPQNAKTAVLDYGAGYAHGPLVAYRWDGEPELSSRGFVATH